MRVWDENKTFFYIRISIYETDLGQRYTPEEIQQIQALIDEGLTNHEIASRLYRTEAGIRNIRHWNKLKTDTTKTLQTLLQKERELNTQISRLKREVKTLDNRLEKTQLVLKVEGQILNKRLQTTLTRLKYEKLELWLSRARNSERKNYIMINYIFKDSNEC